MRQPTAPRVLAPWLLLLALALALGACGGPSAPPPEPPPSLEQPMGLRVLDHKDRPLAGARVSVTALRGRPKAPGPYLTDARGQVQLIWLPLAVNQRSGQASQDQVWALDSSLDYQVEADGYLPAQGHLEAQAQHRQLARPELRAIDIPATVTMRMQTVVLHRLADLLGPGLEQRPADDALARACLAFHDRNKQVVRSLQAQFAWPSFLLEGDLLRVRLDWKGAAWAMLSKLPLAGQISLSTSLPLAILLGEDLLPAPGVKRVSLEILSEISPKEGDPMAAPARARVEVRAPAEALKALAAGSLSPEKFLLDYPPRLVEEGPLAVRPFGDDK